VLPFAPYSPYGTPDDLKDLAQIAHAKGLMVFLDVVYKGCGPDGNYLFMSTPRISSPTGTKHPGVPPSISSAVRVVRCAIFYIYKTLYGPEEYHFDGLRLDAVHAIADDFNPDIRIELDSAIHQGSGKERLIHLIRERHQRGTLSCP
jgi:maltooligosyltrehalose trehalohydrolase